MPFLLGFPAGALNSFLINAMAGGQILADAIGRQGVMNSRTTRLCAAAALLVGMGIALWANRGGGNLVVLIIIAHGMTLLGIPAWMIAAAVTTLVISLLLAVRIGARLLL